MIVPSSALDSMGLGNISGLAALGKAGQLEVGAAGYPAV
jgi:hypothetical protein